MRFHRILFLCLIGAAAAQEAPPNGPRRIDPAWHALVGATVHTEPGKTLAGATVVLRDGRIVSVSNARPPAGARVWDLAGKHVYAGLIDAYVEADPPAHKTTHWNKLVMPERRVRRLDDDTASELRDLGFTAAAIAPRGGIFRGRGAVVSLTPRDPDPSVPRPAVLREDAFQAVGFDRTRGANEGFPTAQMGAIALIRQSMFDKLVPGQRLFFNTDDELEALRAGKIAREFAAAAAIVGSGLEFRRLAAITKDGYPLIVPLDFPREPDVTGVGAAEAVDLRTLMTWEQAPTNPRRLDAAGLLVALTTHRLDKRGDFPDRMRRAIRHGLPTERALAMLTTNPALVLGLDKELGTIAAGKRAHLVVTDLPLFDEDRRIESVWIDGRRHAVSPPEEAELGTWTLNQFTLTFKKRRVSVKAGETRIPGAQFAREGDRVRFSFTHDGRLWSFSGTLDGDTMSGTGSDGAGERFAWRAAPVASAKSDEEKAIDTPATYGYPFGPYARTALPEQPDLVIVTNVTIWTCGPKGIIENGQLEIVRGKVHYVGEARRIGGDGAFLIDGTGKHVTPGIIDCHSHTGISKGINDSGQAVTAEVRIGDVTNPDHIGWYRQLAGGVTVANSLHGSANPIGGQNQVNKVRWGVLHPDDMHFEGAIPGIKFALGENVKQSNWGDDHTTRYPQTRMGVETLMRDRFIAAREYLAREDKTKVDLELEALGEILEGKRLIHCHSYRQDEILMLCRIAKEFGFKIGTFQHVLEGYKVAEAIKEHAIGGSAFSDWWAYKVEVQDAIPFNGALMREVGVVVTFNSDSNDLVRRLNIEAAKAVKYGGVPRAEALKFVTLNAAIQLKIDDRVGSLEKGKDADFAIWSGDPLSVYTKCEQTWIDGRRYWSLEEDAAPRTRIKAERRRILAKVLAESKRRRDRGDDDEADDADPQRRRWIFERLRSGGGDPWESRPGECGCFDFGERR